MEDIRCPNCGYIDMIKMPFDHEIEKVVASDTFILGTNESRTQMIKDLLLSKNEFDDY